MMRNLLAACAFPLLASAANLTIAGTRETRNVTAGQEFQLMVSNAKDTLREFEDRTITHLQLGLYTTTYGAWMCA